MAANFCFKPEFNRDEFTASFQSTNGIEYVVKYKYECFGSRLSKLTLKWEKASSKFIRISVYNENDVNSMRSRKNFYVTDHESRLECIMNMKNGDFIIIDTLSVTDLKQSVAKPASQKSTPNKQKPFVEKKLEQLEIDMRKLLQTGNLSDVIVTDGSKEIAAHKNILSARSSVFAKMFQTPMKENQENRITIEDIPVDVLLELLDFMYAGSITIKDMDMARNLYVAAHKYDVMDLKNICSTMLKSVDLNNVLDILLLADLYSDKLLKEASLNFIFENSSQVKALHNWDSFMKEHHNLAIEILNFVTDKKL